MKTRTLKRRRLDKRSAILEVDGSTYRVLVYEDHERQDELTEEFSFERAGKTLGQIRRERRAARSMALGCLETILEAN